MRTALLISTFLAVRMIATAAADPAISEGAGQWVCVPDDSRQLQVQIDFVERIYRRCDQRTCSTFDLAFAEDGEGTVAFIFGPNGQMQVADDGAHYVETVEVGGRIITSCGACSFRSLDDLYIEDAEHRGS